jgi:hypothetical protein
LPCSEEQGGKFRQCADEFRFFMVLPNSATTEPTETIFRISGSAVVRADSTTEQGTGYVAGRNRQGSASPRTVNRPIRHAVFDRIEGRPQLGTLLRQHPPQWHIQNF